jgi:hypothetical protein
MGWRFRKTFGRGPFRTTISRRGVGWSFGVPGLRYGVSPGGRRYVSAGILGTGLYWIKYLDGAGPGATRSSGPGPPAPIATGGGTPGSSGYSTPPAQPPSTPWWKQKGLGD